jgi:hypothetical protein
LTPDRPGYWLFKPYRGTPERVAVDFEIVDGKMRLVARSPRWPSSLEEMDKLGRWEGPPTAGL